MIKCLVLELNQVFMNLLVNVVQVIQECGSVIICIECCGQCVVVFISDIGYGIVLEYINCIFEFFFIIKLVGSGIGFGLLLFYGIIKKYGGDIYVSSELGKGIIFWIELFIDFVSVQLLSKVLGELGDVL